MTDKIKCKWLGRTGSTPGVGFTVHGEELFLDSDSFDNLKAQGLVEESKPAKQSNSKKAKE